MFTTEGISDTSRFLTVDHLVAASLTLRAFTDSALGVGADAAATASHIPAYSSLPAFAIYSGHHNSDVDIEAVGETLLAYARTVGYFEGETTLVRKRANSAHAPA